MAKLPSEADLGPVQIQGNRGIVTSDVGRTMANAAQFEYGHEMAGISAVQQGNEALGKGMSLVGHEAARAYHYQLEQQNKIDVAEATSKLAVDQLTSMNEINQATDWRVGASVQGVLNGETGAEGTIGDKYETRATQSAENAASGIRNEYTKKLFLLGAQDNTTKISLTARNKEKELYEQEQRGIDTARLIKLRDSALIAPDRVAATALAVVAATAIYDKWVAIGQMKPAEAEIKKREWVSNFVEGRISMLPAAERARELNTPMVGPNGASPSDIAKQFYGVHEGRDHAVLTSFLNRAGGGKMDPANTPWCARFVNSVLFAAGIGGTGSNAARSFLNYGKPVAAPKEGDLVVMSRGTNEQQGHVGFYAGPGSTPGTIKVMGGNTGNSVSTAEYPASRVLGYREIDPNFVREDSIKNPVQPSLVSYMSPDRVVAMRDTAFKEAHTGFQATSVANMEGYERRVFDVMRGTPNAVMPTVEEIRADTALTPTHANVVEKQVITAEGHVESAIMDKQVSLLTPDQQKTMLATTDPVEGQGNNIALQRRRAVMAASMQKANEARNADPIGFAQANGISGAKPLDWKTPATIGAQIGARGVTAQTMVEQYGTPHTLLSKAEAITLKRAYEEQSVERRVPFLLSLREGVQDERSYRALINQIRADSPVTAAAGSILATKTDMKTGGWFGSDYGSTLYNSETVARLMIQGEALLNPSSTASGKDGKGRLFLMPKEDEMHSIYASKIGNALAGDPSASHVLYQAVKAYYAGKASETGGESTTINGRLMREAVDVVSGGISEHNGQVIRPWGMPAHVFRDRIETAYNNEIKKAGLSANATTRSGLTKEIGQLEIYSLRSAPGGGDRYLLQGNGFGVFLSDGKGNPIVLDIGNVPSNAPSPPNTLVPSSIKPEKVRK